jgi:hypothetical protein
MLQVSIRYSNLIQVSYYIQWIYCCVLILIFVFLFCRYLGSGLYQLLLVLIQHSNLIHTILCIQWINQCVLNLIFVFIRCDFHTLLLMLAAMFLMKPAYLQLNVMRSTWLQVAVPRADGNLLHNYAQMYRLSCAIHCNCFCGFNLSLVFIPYIRSGIRRCSFVVSFISFCQISLSCSMALLDLLLAVVVNVVVVIVMNSFQAVSQI